MNDEKKETTEKSIKKINFRYAALGLCGILCIGTVVTSVLLLGKKSDVVIVSPNESSLTSSSYSEKYDSKSAVSAAVTVTSKTTNDSSPHTTVSTSAEKTTTVAAVFPLDINRATKDELMQINGIGEITAQKIIDYRNQVGTITDFSMLTEIDGIGEKTVNKLQEYLYISQENYSSAKSTTNAPVQSEPSPNQEQNVEIEPEKVETTLPEKVRRQVNINTATSEEIADCLMISEELAQQIINVREQISTYTNKLELLYADKMTNEIYNSIEEYVIL